MKSFFENTWKHRAHVIMALPAFLVLLFFAYIPMGGLVMAFKSYDYTKGIWGSPWNGFENFKFLIASKSTFLSMTKNTLLYYVIFTGIGTTLNVVLAIAILFAIKKFLFGKYDDIDKTVFPPSQKISSINELVHVEIPKESQDQTLGELLEKQIGTESGTFQVGQCYFFEGGALRVAKTKNGKVTQIEVIRSKNAPVVLKR